MGRQWGTQSRSTSVTTNKSFDDFRRRASSGWLRVVATGREERAANGEDRKEKKKEKTMSTIATMWMNTITMVT
jgi:hypothetical protein